MWVISAHTLRLSALALWKISESETRRAESMGDKAIGQSFEIEHEFTAMMLMGMSLEALLKGCLIVKNPALVTNHQIDKKLKTHNLVGLFHDARVILSVPERNFCTTLTDYIVWMGRYPIPVDASKAPAILFSVGDRWNTFESLFARIFDSVSNEEMDQARKLYRTREDEFYASVNKSHGIN